MMKSLWVGAAVCLALGSAAAAEVVGGAPAFTAVRAQLERVGCDPFVEDDCVVQTRLNTAFGTVLAEAGDPSRAYSLTRSSFGTQGAFASVDQANDLEAYAESIWADAFVVSGGVGQSIAQVTVLIDGMLDGRGQPGGPGSNAFFALFASDSPLTCDFDEIACTGGKAIPLTEPLSGSRHLSATIAFTYDKPFYLASYLGAEVVGGETGRADFFHSAHLGITAADHAVISTASGTAYLAAAAVPEPTSLALFLGGAMFFCCGGLIRVLPRPATAPLRDSGTAA